MYMLSLPFPHHLPLHLSPQHPTVRCYSHVHALSNHSTPLVQEWGKQSRCPASGADIPQNSSG